MQKYSQTKNLKLIFDISSDYFTSRINIEFFEGLHYFIPPTTSKTKKVVLWDIDAIENWIKSNSNKDKKTQQLLSRR